MQYKVDLHMHTSASVDGNIAPEMIIETARKAGIKTIAIADHNTCAGSTVAQKYIDEKGISDIELIPAIEMDCCFQGTNLHVLGYGVDTSRAEFAKFHHDVETMERAASAEMRSKLETALNIKFDLAKLEKLAGGKTIIAEVMAEALLTDEDYDNLGELNPYRVGGSRADNPYVNFYWDYCAQGKIADVPIELASLDEVVAMIKQAGGIPVLAHPGNNIHEDEKMLKAIINKGIVGIEAVSNYHSREQIEFYLKKANKLNIIITCGSDFHGKTKPSIKMGVFDYNFDEEALLTKFKQAMMR